MAVARRLKPVVLLLCSTASLLLAGLGFKHRATAELKS